MGGAEMGALPRDGAFDNTLNLLAKGYRFIPDRCHRLGTDIFETRLMLRRAVCVQGADAARMFYTPGRFTRRGALPQTTLRMLQDRGSVALLDGGLHHRRKALFLGLLGPGSFDGLIDLFEAEWRRQLQDWQRRDSIVFFDEMWGVLCRAVCRWAGVPLTEREAGARTREFGAMIDGAGSAGPRALHGLLLRRRTEVWARNLIRRVRDGVLAVPEGCVLRRIAEHRDLDGLPMTVAEAAVELINVLRPVVAVDRYLAFTALALHEHPAAAQDLDGEGATAFVQEVRRFYPFFPAVGGRVLTAFDWRDHRFEPGDWVLLDLYGTNHDPRLWEQPERFRPERFHGWAGDPYSLIPQGGGDHAVGHRCPGEWITIALMERTVRLLTTSMRYSVPSQDLRVSLSRLPTHPASGMVLQDIRPTAT